MSRVRSATFLFRDGMEFEIKFAIDGSAAYFDLYHVHTRCYAAWGLGAEAAGELVLPRLN